MRCFPNDAAVVPILWPREAVAILGTGPSLTKADVESLRGRLKVIAVNDAYRLAPWADVLYACDAKWWRWHKGVPTFPGLKYALNSCDGKFPDTGITVLQNTGTAGLELDRRGLKNGRNSGYQAINLAVHLGASRIVLLGYDMGGGSGVRSHFFGEHPDRSIPPVAAFVPYFRTLVEPLKALGVEVLNATPVTALDAFPRVSLVEALAGVPA